MQTPDEQQIRRWADGEEEPPELETLAAIGAEIGKRRKALREQANQEGKLMRAMMPLLYREGMTNLAEMRRVLDTSYLTIDDELTKHGLGPQRRSRRGEISEAKE